MSNGFCKFLPKVENDSIKNDKEDSQSKKVSFIKIQSSQDKSIKNEYVKTLITEKETKKPKNKRTPTCGEYNVLEIDERIKELLNKNIENLPTLKKKASILEWIKENSDDKLEILDAKKELRKLTLFIQEIESGKQSQTYIDKTNDLIEQYKIILNSPIKRSFVLKTNEGNSEQNALLDDKNAVITTFIDIAKEYIHIDPIKQKTKKVVCPICKIDEFDYSCEEVYKCMKCGLQIDILDDTPTFRDTDRINLATRYTYTIKGHFKEAIEKFEARQNTTIPEQLYVGFKNWAEKHSLEIKDVTKTHIYMYLKEYGYSSHYEDATLIYCNITGKQPPNISKYIPDIMDDFDKYEPVYQKLKGAERTNSLNVQYKLFKLLEKRGYKCNHEDFYILKTSDKIKEHDDMHREICKALKWKYKPTLIM
jgi:hypothetical protein